MLTRLTPPRLTSLLPLLENWLVSWYNMVRPRLRASLKWGPLFLLCLLSSEPVTHCQLDQEAWVWEHLEENTERNGWTLSGLCANFVWRISPGIVPFICSRLCPTFTVCVQTMARIKLPIAKTLSVFSERMLAQTGLLGRVWQWWTGVHGENESRGPEDGPLVNHA